MDIGFIGLGKLGMDAAEVMATKHKVCGYDVEPRSSDTICVVPTIKDVVEGQDIVFIAVPTPHSKEYDGSLPSAHLAPKDFDYTIVKECITEANKYMTKDQLLVLISTVLPGTTRREFVPLITNTRFIYNPYLIAMGSVKWDMVNPEMVMININVDVVTDALAKSTMRIMGPKYMTAGMGDAGGCHPRDNIALRYMAQSLGLGYDLFDSIMGAREIQAKNIAKRLVTEAELHGLSIWIHGKSFKPNVSYIDGSYSTLIGHYVKEMGHIVHYIDPLAETNNPTHVHGVILLAHCAEITYDYADIEKAQQLYCIIQDNSIVVDPWRRYTTDNSTIKVIHYGNTRPR